MGAEGRDSACDLLDAGGEGADVDRKRGVECGIREESGGGFWVGRLAKGFSADTAGEMLQCQPWRREVKEDSGGVDGRRAGGCEAFGADVSVRKLDNALEAVVFDFGLQRCASLLMEFEAVDFAIPFFLQRRWLNRGVGLDVCIVCCQRRVSVKNRAGSRMRKAPAPRPSLDNDAPWSRAQSV